MPLNTPARRLCLLLPLIALLTGCTTPTQPIGNWFGPATPATITITKQHHPDGTNWLVQSDHYAIYTTIDDDALVRKIAELMEASLGAYHTLAPGVPITDHRMDCYLFSNHAQWAEFTRERTGAMAATYLQINRGGYAVGDWYVSYYLGDTSTLSVAAHEGWHQFAFRHFKGRLPPFLEEGLATMFEGVKFSRDPATPSLPHYNLSINQNRAIALRNTIESNSLWPLAEVIGMHAGQVVGKSGAKIDAFYSQAWAFGRFLWDGENGKYRPILQRILADTAAGTVYDPTGSLEFRTRPWNPASAKLMLEHYLGENIDQIAQEYDRFIKHVAYDELPVMSDEPPEK